MSNAAQFFPYDIDRAVAPLVRPFGVRADRDGVTLEPDGLRATFGFLGVRTSRDNIVSATVTGPYRWVKCIGARLSLADHGLTFGTNARRGVCLQFRDPVQSAFGPWDHPGLTVTVADPEALVAALGLEPGAFDAAEAGA